MLNNGNKTNCEFIDDIVSYIYDEIGTAERARFETHLPGCHECTNEFAAISNARLSIVEWRREEFADLPTPEIVIPYPAKRNAVKETASVGLLTGLRGWLSYTNFPVAVAAGLVVCIGLGFFLIMFLGRSETNLVANLDVPPIKAANNTAVIPSPQIRPESLVETVLPDRGATHKIQPAKVVENRRARSAKQKTVAASVNRYLVPTISNAPVLSENYDEAEDNSLRLSALFAEVDS